MEEQGDRFIAHLDCEGAITTDLVLSAIGRQPNAQDLGLDRAGVKSDDNGRIITNDDYQTAIPHIYAVGDVTNQYHLTPIAIKEGHCLADRLFGGVDPAACRVDYDQIPTAIFFYAAHWHSGAI